MNIALFAYSRQGCKTAGTIVKTLADHTCRTYTLERFEAEGFLPLEKPSESFYGGLFAWADAMIFVGSCGIAVRQIAPHVRDKKTDPAVLCVDELGLHVIPLLSGHIGGANHLTRVLARALDAEAVITTATDINKKFSVDTWATEQGCTIGSMALAKAVSAAILEHPVPICSDFPMAEPLPGGLIRAETGDLGIAVTWKTEGPFEKTLRLLPKALKLGLGCRKNTPREKIEAAVDQVLKENGIDSRAIRCAASIDLKAQEQGLLDFCEARGWPVSFYTAEALQQVEGNFTPSAFVRRITGVDNVCERSALLGADHLIVRKTALDGVTVAVAAETWEVHFG